MEEAIFTQIARLGPVAAVAVVCIVVMYKLFVFMIEKMADKDKGYVEHQAAQMQVLEQHSKAIVSLNSCIGEQSEAIVKLNKLINEQTEELKQHISQKLEHTESNILKRIDNKRAKTLKADG